MQLKCPVCDHSEIRAHRAWRLEVCPHCHADGREVYLTVATEAPRVGRVRPRPLSGLARAASRFGRPAV